MNEIIDVLSTATTLFGVVTTLAVLVTGFFIGRAWLRRLSGESFDSRGYAHDSKGYVVAAKTSDGAIHRAAPETLDEYYARKEREEGPSDVPF